MIAIETVEDWLSKATTTKKIWNGISKELCLELEEENVLEQIVRKRVRKTIKEEYFLEISEEKLAEEWFSTEIDRHYLERRDALESVSFWMVRNANKGIILEIYQRLQHNEEEWETISDRWGMEPEKNYRGRYNKTPIKKITKEIRYHLMRLKPNEISEPVKIGNVYSILKLGGWKKVELDGEMRKKLERELLEDWLEVQTLDIIKRKIKEV